MPGSSWASSTVSTTSIHNRAATQHLASSIFFAPNATDASFVQSQAKSGHLTRRNTPPSVINLSSLTVNLKTNNHPSTMSHSDKEIRMTAQQNRNRFLQWTKSLGTGMGTIIGVRRLRGCAELFSGLPKVSFPRYSDALFRRPCYGVLFGQGIH
jgi:hypothetical protein